MKMLFQDVLTLAADLAFINLYLAFISDVIDQLRSRGLSLNQQIELVKDACSRIAAIPGSRGAMMKLKADDVFSKNEDYSILKQLNVALNHGTSNIPETMPPNPAILSCFNYTPITSVDVERSFSQYELI